MFQIKRVGIFLGCLPLLLGGLVFAAQEPVSSDSDPEAIRSLKGIDKRARRAQRRLMELKLREKQQAAAEPLADLTWRFLEEERYAQAWETIERWELLQPHDPRIPLLKKYATQLEKEPDPTKREELVKEFVIEGMNRLAEEMSRVHQGLEDLSKALERLKPQERADKLTLAAAQGETVNVRMSLTRGGDPNEKDSFGTRALEHAATGGHLEVAELLLDHGADVNIRGLLGVTPLMLAAGKGHTEMVQFLVDRGAEINLTSETGRTALGAARAERHFHIVQLLEEAGAVEFRAPRTTAGPITQERLPEMLSSGDKDSDLLDAALGGEVKRMLRLLNEGADVNARGALGMTPLMFATQNGHVDAVNELLQSGADADVKSNLGYTALMSAAMEGHTHAAQALVLWKADVNAKGFAGMTALMHAAQNNHAELAGMLIGWGADVDLKNDFGMTPLMFAAQNGYADPVRLLLQEGADFSAREEIAGQTALALAKRKEHWDVVEIFEGAEESAGNPL